MPDAGLVTEVTDALNRAEADGFQRGYAQAVQDFYGQNAAFLFANIFADAMDAAAGRLAVHDANFSNQISQFGVLLRSAVTPPRATAQSPAADATGVADTAPVSVTFDMDMDEATFTTTSFFVNPVSGGVSLQGVISYDGPSRTATFTPTNGWSAGVEYRVTIEGVCSAQGRGLPDPLTWTFTAT